jgi:hypothetical protein
MTEARQESESLPVVRGRSGGGSLLKLARLERAAGRQTPLRPADAKQKTRKPLARSVAGEGTGEGSN